MAIVFPSAAAAALQTPIYTFSPTSTPLVNSVNNTTYTYDVARGAWTAAGSAPTVIAAATLAEAAVGTLNTVYSSPLTSVPKDASGMTGAAILPSGTDAQRAAIATPVVGMTRFNTDYAPDSLEVYDGTTWKQIAYVPDLGPLGSYTAVNGATLPSSGVYETITIPAGVTVNVPATCRLYARTSITVSGTVQGNGVGAPGGPSASGSSGGLGSSAPTAGFGLGSTSGVPSLNGYGFNTQFVGSGGGGGAITWNNGGGTNGAGGASGGTLILECEGPITVSSTASIQMNGANAAVAISNLPGTTGIEFAGSGGGSGGLIVLQSSQSLTINAGATLSVNGGNGANAVYVGVLSGDIGGGGGGGAGYIVLNSPNTTNSGTTSLTGGAAGSNLGTGANTTGAAGGSFGGRGGFGGYSGTPPTAGGNNSVILNAYV